MPRKVAARSVAIRTKDSFKVPSFNILNYQMSLIAALNYYNEVMDDDGKKRKFAYEYWKTKGRDVSQLDSLADSWFHTYGAIAHMALNDVPLHDDDLDKLDKQFDVLLSKVVPVEKKVQTVAVDKTDSIASMHIGNIEAAIDDFISKDVVFDLKAYVSSNDIKPNVIKKIGEWFADKYTAMNDAYVSNDEAYSYLGKRKLKKVVELLFSIVSDCDVMTTIVKTARKPRVKKERPVGKIVEKLQYMVELKEIGLKSISPTKIVGASQVWLYNTKIRRLFKYDALDQSGITVKGTTLLNWNPETSGSKIIRKPEVQLKDASGMMKKATNALYDSIKGTVGKVTGRVSDDCIILGAF